MDKKYKVLWISDLVVATGFSRVSHEIIENLPKETFEIHGLGINYNGDPHNYTFPIYPATLGGDLYGLGRLKNLCGFINPDLIFILNDPWMIARYLKIIKGIYKESSAPKIVVYFPVDAKIQDPDWYKDFDIVSKVFTYTEFAKTEINKCIPALEVGIIPHGVNKKHFFPYSDKKKVRKELFGDKQDIIDSFIFLNANRNQPRKKLEIALEGFKLFVENKDKNIKFYSHCGILDSYADINKLALRYGIDDRIIVTTLATGAQQIPIEHLNKIYNISDVGVNCSLGEGWSLTNMEHTITGAPQIVSDHSALHEIYKDIGLLVPAKIPWLHKDTMTVGYMSLAEDFAVAFEEIYQNKVLYEELSRAGIKKFSSPEYDWKNISERFKNAFLEVL